MVKNFKGEVKISDVKTEFDNLVNRINNMIEAYNISGQVEDMDYTVGGGNLSPAGYTLSVGGLKKGLAAVERNVIGAKCFKVDNNRVKVSDGIILTKQGAVRLPDSIVYKPENYHTLYYNRTTESYQWVGGDDVIEVDKVLKLNSRNVLNPETGLYHLDIDPDRLGDPFRFNDSGSTTGFNFGLYKRPIIMDTITIDTPRFISDSESIVQKLIIDLPSYQYVNLNTSETPLKDLVIEAKCNEQEGYRSFVQMSEGYLFGKYTPNDEYTNKDTFDPRFSIVPSFEYSYDSGKINLFFSDNTERNDRFYNIHNNNWNTGLLFRSDIGFNTGKYKQYSLPISEANELVNDISDYKITIEKHNNRLMIVLMFTFKTKTYDHYEGDLYQNDSTKFSDNHMYMFLYLDNKYEDFTVGNVAILSDGPDSRVATTEYDLVNNFNPSIIKICGNNPVTDEANIHYTVLESSEYSENVFRVCDININRNSKFVSDTNTIQAENFNGRYKITSESKTFGGGGTLRYSNVNIDSNEPVFISGIDAERFEREGTSSVYLLGDNIAWNRQPGHRNLNYWTPVNMLFLPKGLPNPFGISNGDASKSFKVIIDKKVE